MKGPRDCPFKRKALTCGLVPLHPASEPSRRQFLFDHLTETLPPLRIVLRFDRRPARGDDNVPFAVQASDALAALGVLHGQLLSEPGHGANDARNTPSEP